MLLSVPMMTYLKAVLLVEYVPPGYRDPLLIIMEGDRRAPRRHETYGMNSQGLKTMKKGLKALNCHVQKRFGMELGLKPGFAIVSRRPRSGRSLHILHFLLLAGASRLRVRKSSVRAGFRGLGPITDFQYTNSPENDGLKWF